MFKFKCNISLIIFLVSVQAFSQQNNYHDSLDMYNSQKTTLKTRLHYSLGSTFMFVPHLGSVSGFTITPSLSVPLSPKLSVDGGIIAGRYYSTFESNHEGEFNEISVFGSARYDVNPRLTLFGAGIKQVKGNSEFNMLPKSSYIFGSSYNLGSFSIGVSVEMSNWNNNLSPLPFNGSQGFYNPFEQRPGTIIPFGR